jgi:hypothetical protein
MNAEDLIKIIAPVADEKNVRAWSEQDELLKFLEEQRGSPWLALYGSSFNKGSFFLHSVLIHERDIKGIAQNELHMWDNMHNSWSCGVVLGGGKSARVEFDRPSIQIGNKVMKNGQQLVFSRSFNGRHEDRHYFEIAQFLAHAHDLHWVPERHAWCRFDNDGDIEEIILWAEIAGRGGYGTATAISIRREVIEMQMSASKTVLIQMFDSTVVPEEFHGWARRVEAQNIEDENSGLYYSAHIEGDKGSYFRGIQIIKPKRTATQLGVYLENQGKQPKQYETFITHDWKNGDVTPVSCDPASIASYFEKGSPLPFEISPVFFNAAVLDKYKADPEKYSLEHRSITCRNAWSLQTYDVNEQGQVHTYIKYLGDLPYKEQIYWKAFNESPKGPISKRAYTTDFEGNFDQELDSLRDLQALLLKLHSTNTKWFTLREPDLLRQFQYPLTSSSKAWGDALATLAKVVNEGLEMNFFKSKVNKLGIEGDAKWGSIRWAQESLKVGGVSGEVVAEIIEPLRDLQKLRTLLDAHSGGAEATSMRANLLRRFKSPKAHVAHLGGQLVRSLQLLSDLNKP